VGESAEPSVRPGSWPSLVALAVTCFVLVRLAWSAGGYFPPAYLSAGAIAFAALAVLVAVRVPHWRLSTEALVGMGALAGLTAWTALSSDWSLAPEQALLDFQRDLLYVALFGLALLAAGSGRQARLVVWAALAFVLVVAGAGLLSRFYPHLLHAAEDREGIVGYRLSYPLSYWNAYGGLAAMGAILGLGLAADPRTPVPLRALSAAATVVLWVAMYLSLSRGAWLAVFAGLVVLVALGAHRGSLLLTSAVVGGAAVIATLRLRGYPVLVDRPGPGQASAGGHYAPQLIALTVAAGAVQWVLAAGRASPNLMQALRRTLRPIAMVLGGALLLLALVGYLVKSSEVEGHTDTALRDTGSWVSRQWRDFLQPTTKLEHGTARLTSARGTRSDLYRVAIDGFQDHPVRGDGSGSFEYRWARERRVDEKVRDAHSLELETLGELGLVGGLLLLAFLGSVIHAAVRARIRPAALSRGQAAAVGAACAVWIAHSAVDWDWQVPALTGPAIVLAATLFPYGRRRRSGRRRAAVPAARCYGAPARPDAGSPMP
jgi:hypothetical protein